VLADLDEFTAIAYKWRDWSDGCGELRPSAESALSASSRQTVPRVPE
jgi:hypothetical protein